SAPIFRLTSFVFGDLRTTCGTEFNRNDTMTTPSAGSKVLLIRLARFSWYAIGSSSSVYAGGWSHNGQRKYSRIVDFTVPRPPIKQLYCALNSMSIRPRNLLFDTASLLIIIDGLIGDS